MIMGPGLRKFALAAHVTFSVGWIGAAAAYIPLDIAAATSPDAETLRASYLAMDLVARWAIVPLALASLLTGLIMALGTRWGLFRHYWTLISLILTVLAVLVLLVETRTIGDYATIAADPSTSDAGLRALGNTLVHSAGGTMVLFVIMWLNVYKPQGLTRYGWRRELERRANLHPEAADAAGGRVLSRTLNLLAFWKGGLRIGTPLTAPRRQPTEEASARGESCRPSPELVDPRASIGAQPRVEQAPCPGARPSNAPSSPPSVRQGLPITSRRGRMEPRDLAAIPGRRGWGARPFGNELRTGSR